MTGRLIGCALLAFVVIAAVLMTGQVYLFGKALPQDVSGFQDAEILIDARSSTKATSFALDKVTDPYYYYMTPTPPLAGEFCHYPHFGLLPEFESEAPALSDAIFEPVKVEFSTGPKADSGCHIVRPPPVMPRAFQNGDYSGYCQVDFRYTIEGRTSNISIGVCTDDSLRDATQESVRKWLLLGSCVPSTTMRKTNIRFELVDENGDRLPLPPGF